MLVPVLLTFGEAAREVLVADEGGQSPAATLWAIPGTSDAPPLTRARAGFDQGGGAGP